MLVFLAVTSLLLFARAEEQDTQKCYGNGFKKTIGLTKETTDISLHCSTCVQPEACSSDAIGNACVRLSDDHIHFFSESGTALQDRMPLVDCTPWKVQDASENGFVVLCASSPPDYQPKRQYYSREFGNGFELNKLQQARMDYAQQANNYAVVNIGFDEYVITLIQDSNKIVVEYGSEPYEHTVSDCSRLHQVIAGSLPNDYFQLVITCTSTEGGEVRWRLVVDGYHLWADPVIQSLYDPLQNDSVSFENEGKYIMYKGSRSVAIVRTSDVGADPGIIPIENGRIDAAEFISGEHLLLSIDGQPHEVWNIPTFFDSNFEHGRTVLAKSEAHCPEGRCAPHRVSEGKLYLFNKDSSNYLYLVSYDLSDLTAEPTRIARSVITDEFDTCFKTVANIDTEPSPITPTTESTTVETTSTTEELGNPGSTSSASGLQSRSTPLTSGAIVGIALGCSTAVVTVVVLTALCFLCCYCRKRHLEKSCKMSPKNVQVTDKQSADIRLCFSQTRHLGYPQPISTSGGSRGASSTPSSAPSLTKLDGTETYEQAPTDKTVRPYQESVLKHADMRPGVAPTEIVVKQ